MKKILAVWLTAVMLLAGACAGAQAEEASITTPRPGLAVAAPEDIEGTVPMYDRPDTHGEVLMTYYSGTVMEVIRLETGGMVQVQCGPQEASIRGYMRAEDLRYGAEAMREVPTSYMSIRLNRDVKVYGYCDGQAGVIGERSAGENISVCSKNDEKWVQLFEVSGTDGGDCGFVKMDTGVGKGEFVVCERDYPTAPKFVEPLEDEMTREQAYERAIDYILDGGYDPHGFFGMLPEKFQSREGLLSMNADVRLWYYPETGNAFWNVILEDPDNCENNIIVEMTTDGELTERQGISKGYG